MIVCLCRAVDDRAIRAAIDDGAETVDEVGAHCRAGTCCGACRDYIEDMIASSDRKQRALPLLPVPA